MVDKVFGLILLLSPVAYTTGVSLDIFDLIFLHLATMGLVMATLFDTPKRTISKNAVYLICSLLGINLIILYVYHFDRVILSAFDHLFFIILSLIIVICYVSDIKRLYRYISYAVILNLIVFVLQRFGVNFIFDMGLTKGEEGGLLGNAPRLVSYLCIVLPILLSQSWLWVIPLLMVSLITKELTLIPILIITLYFTLTKYRKLFYLIVSISTLIFIPLYSHKVIDSLLMRWQFWHPTLIEIFKRPSIGYGLGSFIKLSPFFIDFPFHHLWTPFSSYLNLIFCTGLLGAVWLGVFFREYIKRFSRTTVCLSLLALLILMSVESVLEIPRLWFTIVAILGLYTIETYRLKLG